MTEARHAIEPLLNSGDFIRSAWVGPHWTPYAQVIANHYRRIVPWFLTAPTTLSLLGTPSRRIVLTQPYQHDVLIMGLSASVTQTNPDNGNFIYLNITHMETGLSWAEPNVLDSAPLPAWAGINNSAMPVLALPDAFFLPKGTQLRLDWAAVAGPTAPPPVINTQARLTFVGVQLIDPFEGHAPLTVPMPDGKTIEVGSRVPWFGTTGVGLRDDFFAEQGPGYALATRNQRLQYLVSADCDVEVHDAYANFITGAVNTTNLVFRLVDLGSSTYWNPSNSPTTSIFGSELQINPALPFTKPYLLKKGHRIYFQAQNNVTGAAALFNGLVTLRGTRLCEF